MARNRKRAKERRARRPQPVGRPARDGTARGIPTPLEPREVIGPLEHAAPDAELAEEQIELGAIEEEAGLDGGEARDEQAYEALAEDEAEMEEEEEARAATVAIREPRTPGNRVLTFLKGSWAELQRVQWPDRRQVVQATGVVIGFVIVAGLFLGLADLVAKHLINYILYGHS